MPSPPVPDPPSDSDYEAIEAAVMETYRGRWFLAEYARRNRQADTTMLLAALERIESVIRGERGAQSADRIRFDLIEMSKAISRTKAEIAAIKPDAAHHGKFGEATEELDSIVLSTESATSDILAAAEQIQEAAWTLRELGVEPEVCDLLDAKATEVYTACSFQDLTGQRTRKVIQVMRYLEGRINAMIDIWDLDGSMAEEAREAERARQGDAALLNGPALPGQGLDQADVDMVMGPAVQAAAAAARARDDFEFVDVEDEPEAARHAASQPARPGVARDLPPAIESPAIAAEPEPVAPLVAAAQSERRESRRAPRPIPPSDPLAPVMALSDEEKIALFS